MTAPRVPKIRPLVARDMRSQPLTACAAAPVDEFASRWAASWRIAFRSTIRAEVIPNSRMMPRRADRFVLHGVPATAMSVFPVRLSPIGEAACLPLETVVSDPGHNSLHSSLH